METKPQPPKTIFLLVRRDNKPPDYGVYTYWVTQGEDWRVAKPNTDFLICVSEDMTEITEAIRKCPTAEYYIYTSFKPVSVKTHVAVFADSGVNLETYAKEWAVV